MSVSAFRRTCLRVAILLVDALSLRADELGNERHRMKAIAKTVSHEIDKRYYDANLKPELERAF